MGGDKQPQAVGLVPRLHLNPVQFLEGLEATKDYDTIKVSLEWNRYRNRMMPVKMDWGLVTFSHGLQQPLKCSMEGEDLRRMLVSP